MRYFPPTKRSRQLPDRNSQKKQKTYWRPFISNERLHFFLFVSPKTRFSDAIWFFFRGQERVVFLTKNVQNKIYPILSTYFFCTCYDIFLQKRTALLCPFVFFFNRHESGVFLTKNIQKHQLYCRCLFLTLFWFFSPKTSKSHAHLIFCYKKNKHESGVFLMKNF